VLTEFGLKIAPSTYYAALTRRPSRRAVRDEELKTMIVKIYEENYSVYGAKKVWRQLRRNGVQVGRCRVERLMRDLQLVGALRGKIVRTTVSDPAAERAADLVKRQFTAGAPNRLWVADFTYVATWAGTVYTAFAIDAFSRKIVGWKTSMSKETDLVLDAIDMALRARHYQPGPRVDKLVHHSDAGSQLRLNLSSQHLDREVCYGARARLGRGSDGQAADAVTGSPTGRPQETSAIVLDSDRTGGDKYRCRAHGRRVAGPRHSVVPRMWRSDTSVGFPRGFGPVPVVRRA
jgi:putative transposase